MNVCMRESESADGLSIRAPYRLMANLNFFFQNQFTAKPFYENIVDQLIHIEECSTVRTFQKIVPAKAGFTMFVTEIPNGLIITDDRKWFVTRIVNGWIITKLWMLTLMIVGSLDD